MPRPSPHYVGAFVDELAQQGVRDVVFCPGSRSTPLALLCHRHPLIRTWLHLDERSAAFFALGMAKARRAPVAVLATSGTATVNFAPAVVEAFTGRTPLLVLTADRPPELRDVGALQTIDQYRLYGNHILWFQEMLLPEISESAQRQARAAAARAVAISQGTRPGPVHLNFPFREPLVPRSSPLPLSPPLQVHHGVPQLSPMTLAALARELGAVQRGLVVCGPQEDLAFPPAAVRLAQRLGWPLLADVLSGVRCGPWASGTALVAFDSYLRDPALAHSLAPECILRFGATPVSKALQHYVERYAGCRQLVVDGGGGWPDPALVASEVLWAEPGSFCQALADTLGPTAADPAWRARWTLLDQLASASLAAELASEPTLSEPGAIAALAAALPEGATLVLGNSMPVRDAESVLPASTRRLRLLANRGASGIDGVVSTALGVSAVSAGPVALAIGDISFYHDLNGLLAARLHRLSATVLLLHNDGGGIFSFLPQAEQGEAFEELFGTPHGLDFAAIAPLYDLQYQQVETHSELEAALRASLGAPGVQVIAVRTERAANVARHRALVEAVRAALATGTRGG
ncbi:MAG: 2-succinyl-5-enolpyruvyl-6-hydroxy-3-cyclohexene-1-carboxylate synthase [Dehalococcoidia bacterium]|nr:MAG: 2-succinyl-5-enolpyruvyl-6-hydroxy-3-cyclohexene-1-carboxylate synthase [Dehalococcoidia bacterium]